jgi:hypothetical protein
MTAGPEPRRPYTAPESGAVLADPGPLPEEPELLGPGDLLVAIRVADAEALMVLAQRATGVRPETSAMDVLFRVSEAVRAALGDAPAPPKPAGRLARIEVKGFRDLGVVRVTEVTFAGEPMVHAERTPWSLPAFEGDAADFPASSLHFVTWLPDAWPVVQEPGPKRAITSGPVLDCGCGPAEFCEDCDPRPEHPF